ncbi:twin-arginine translocation signal domain-containing protein [Lactobacillus reuteri]|nr:twin-arginine translocation signal domain-containing protein [Limosilactobacillus reuteri]
MAKLDGSRRNFLKKVGVGNYVSFY